MFFIYFICIFMSSSALSFTQETSQELYSLAEMKMLYDTWHSRSATFQSHDGIYEVQYVSLFPGGLHYIRSGESLTGTFKLKRITPLTTYYIEKKYTLSVKQNILIDGQLVDMSTLDPSWLDLKSLQKQMQITVGLSKNFLCAGAKEILGWIASKLYKKDDSTK